ncbi:MAG: aminopeptidase P family N-terminal domain-containing protein, partial [Planctomycetota bacterium]|nr:aminopeptidase P family N-terminal domain-containing protein [Planctomycetota bacterium]
MKDMISRRLERVREEIAKRKLDAFLVSNAVNVQYLSGFTGDDTVLLISRDKAFLVTDFRYVEQAEQEAPLFKLVRHKKGYFQRAMSIAKERKLKRVGIEGGAMSHSTFAVLERAFKRLKLEPQKPLVEELRMVKNAEEISLIRAAAHCAAEAYKSTVRGIRPGMTEMDIATDLEYRMRRLGARRGAFETIVAVN